MLEYWLTSGKEGLKESFVESIAFRISDIVFNTIIFLSLATSRSGQDILNSFYHGIYYT